MNEIKKYSMTIYAVYKNANSKRDISYTETHRVKFNTLNDINEYLLKYYEKEMYLFEYLYWYNESRIRTYLKGKWK